MTDERNSLPGEPSGDDITAEFNAALKAAGAAREKMHGVPLDGERRSRRRSLISAPVRVRKPGAKAGDPEDISTTLDVSRGGILFVSEAKYAIGADVAVTFPYTESLLAVQAELNGRVVRIAEMPDGRFSIGIALAATAEEIAKERAQLKAAAAAEAEKPKAVRYSRSADSEKPLVLAVDADEAMREAMKNYLTAEGYDVIAVGSSKEAREVLSQLTPSLLIAEIEGADLPGYDLCAHVKSTPRLQTIPVMLLTSSAYPSDYANAHSLGAVVCMAKPYRQERLGHMVRMLAPPSQPKTVTHPRGADRRRKPATGAAGGGSAHGVPGHAGKPSTPPKSSFRNRFRFSRWGDASHD